MACYRYFSKISWDTKVSVLWWCCSGVCLHKHNMKFFLWWWQSLSLTDMLLLSLCVFLKNNFSSTPSLKIKCSWQVSTHWKIWYVSYGSHDGGKRTPQQQDVFAKCPKMLNFSKKPLDCPQWKTHNFLPFFKMKVYVRFLLTFISLWIFRRINRSLGCFSDWLHAGCCSFVHRSSHCFFSPFFFFLAVRT